jgi:hypothetical protein
VFFSPASRKKATPFWKTLSFGNFTGMEEIEQLMVGIFTTT